MTEEVHTLGADVVAERLGVDPAQGLSADEVQARLQKDGPNRLEEGETEPTWRAFLRQYRDFMQILLAVAAAVSWLALGETTTAVVLFGLTVLNAWMGLRQEAKAEESISALRDMMRVEARVRRGGTVLEVDIEELVVGDIVLFEAGDIVPADGRLIIAATLEIEESALTGESVPVLKSVDSVPEIEAPIGDRLDMAYMNCSVTRGRGEMIVTATGMDTEVGHVADLLNNVETVKTPLQRQLDKLTLVIAALAIGSLVIIIMQGMSQGNSLEEMFGVGVAMAVAAIPTGLPAIVMMLLAIGSTELARQNAIVKRLPSVETLGSVSAICSDKTGTLTLNRMTAREMRIVGHQFSVSGEGYSTEGDIRSQGGEAVGLEPFLLPLALCSDAVLDGDDLVGDPTEGAVIVLAEKGGIDVELARQAYPRVAELPFDSEYKLMATFHELKNDAGERVIRCFTKGAPDVLIARSSDALDDAGQIIPIGDARGRVLEANALMAERGLRVLVAARRDFDPDTFDPDGDLLAQMTGLTLLSMIGIVDPPRPEAKAAIAESVRAGIRVRMITGDHAVTAAAIGDELGITGRALTGAEFSAMSDDELVEQLDDIGVVARVAPEDKIRLVQLLQREGNIVSMTGDGVNDAPALKEADIGVAMGITGTEVSKQAAAMILTDDNFATIVHAVEFGRGLYDNLLKYLRFQMSTLFGYVLLFLGSVFTGIAGGIPLLPLQTIFINTFIDAPIGVGLGFGKSASDLMDNTPRSPDEPVFRMSTWIRMAFYGAIMATIALLMYVWAEGEYGSDVVAGTMLVVSLTFLHIYNGLGSLSAHDSVFSRETLDDPRQVKMFGLSLLSLVLMVELPLFQRIFDTASLSLDQWMICAAVGLPLLVVDEVIKLVLRRKQSDRDVLAEAA